MSEAELQRLVADLCAQLGLHHYHTHDSRGSEGGFPDSVIVGTAILFREIKSRDGVLKPAQRRWGSRIERSGGNWAVWRPVDWYSGVIRLQLEAISEPRRATRGSALRVSTAQSCP
jgi:hypothetical protein